MNTGAQHTKGGVRGFRTRLLVGMMLVATLVTAMTLYVAQKKAAADAGESFRRVYEAELAATRRAHELRQAALTERSRALARRPRIHAALEDNALDLLYPSARDELRDLLAPAEESHEDPGFSLHATFYRFLDANGAVITPPSDEEVGHLSAEEEARLALRELPQDQQTGLLLRHAEDGGESVDEIVAAPIFSTETNEVIAAIVLGFKPASAGENQGSVRRGIWLEGRLVTAGWEAPRSGVLTDKMQAVTSETGSFEATVQDQPCQIYFTRLTSGELFRPAYELSLFPLNESQLRQQHLRWQILSTGGMLLLAGLFASHIMSGRLSQPVEELVIASARNRAERERAVAELEQTNVELQRSMRFSSDASHQLKTPVTVLRAGLEELLQQPGLDAQHGEEVSRLIFQTSRLGSMIHDLLLLSRLDGGRMSLELQEVNLSQLVDSLADDFSAMPEPADFHLETDVPPDLHVLGEKRYTDIILANLLENARKYNHPGGNIRIRARQEEGRVRFTVGNTGPGIPPEAQGSIFERFHRGNIGENIPGHGLGLNLARELARLHGGDLRLAVSTPEWTEFEVVFRPADPQ